MNGVLELQRISSAGAPIISGCGMTRAGLAGLVAAEAILRGEDPVRHTNRSLRGWRALNRSQAQGMTWLAPLTGFVASRWPVFAMRQGAVRPAIWAAQHPELAGAEAL